MANGVRYKILIQTLSLVFIVNVVSACSWQEANGPSYLVIAIDSLGRDRLTCEDDEASGHETNKSKWFCSEAIRFTHAYTPSTLAQPAMASLLTALYPIEHGVRHNGHDALANRIRTVAEVAAERGIRTSFFSGGVPLLRKSGLSQGFETFDDSMNLSGPRLYRHAIEVVHGFTSWLEREANRGPFYSVLYFSDLQFPEFKKGIAVGELREAGLDAQRRRVEDALLSLQMELQRLGKWRDTTIFLVGLTGNGTSQVSNEPSPLNLRSENTLVTFFLKPREAKGDGVSPGLKVDRNVSLVDVGQTLFDFLESDNPVESSPELQKVSLRPLINSGHVEWEENRLILIESGWGHWRWVGPVRLAGRRGQYLYVHDEEPKLYNSLIDRSELSPLAANDPSWVSLDEGLVRYFRGLNLPRFQVAMNGALARIIASQNWFQDETLNSSDVLEKQKSRSQYRRWFAQRALRRQDWSSLSLEAEREKDSVMNYVARRNLGLSARVPLGRCRQYFSASAPAPREGETPCDDELLARVHEAATSRDEERREKSFEVAMRAMRLYLRDEEWAEENYRRFLIWDLKDDLPLGLTLPELFLALPERRHFAEFFKQRVSREDRAVNL